MNDRFKFRYLFDNEICEVLAFDISDGIENKCLFLQLKDGTRKIINNYDWSKFMQCTGLKDKNGKLIYEGDVVKKEGFYWEVIWNTDITYQWSLRRIEPNSIYPHIITFSSLLSWKKYEVIGNIYENEDLLQKECE